MSRPRMLVTGACGLLGAHVVAAADDHYDVVGLDRNPWWGHKPARIIVGDLLDGDFRARVMTQTRPDVVIHCAAKVDVDGCERDPVSAYAMNAEVSADLARLAGHAHFVYVTTDSYFRGDRALVPETEPPCPRTVYARSKLHGEWDVLLSEARSLIVRTNLYGWSSGAKRTFGEWLYGALERAESITLFDDVYYTPIYVGHLVGDILALVDGGHTGVFNVAGGERVSKYEFGMALAGEAGLATGSVTRGSIEAAGLAANRPKDMSLDTSKVSGALGRRSPGLIDGVRRFVRDRGRPLDARGL